MKSPSRSLVLRLVVFGTALAAAFPSGGIIMRHDVPEARYRDFGEKYRGYIVQLALPGSKPGAQPNLYNAMGTLIGPHWVITAAHAAARFQPGRPDSIDLQTHNVFVNGRGYRIAKAFVHPRFVPPNPNGSDDGGLPDDIALLRLETDVKDAKIACLYDGNDELGKPVVVAGMGLPGNGISGVGEADGALRAASVNVDNVAPNAISWTFRPPTDPKSTPLEGISGPGDSGGPAFIERSGQVCVAGISSAQDTKDGPQGLYGVIEYYTRVSSHLDWIRKVMSENP
jgi:trypsin